MRLFVMYDISENPDREKFSDILETMHFAREQYSIFSCTCNENEFLSLKNDILAMARQVYNENSKAYRGSNKKFSVIVAGAEEEHVFGIHLEQDE